MSDGPAQSPRVQYMCVEHLGCLFCWIASGCKNHLKCVLSTCDFSPVCSAWQFFLFKLSLQSPLILYTFCVLL